MFGPKLKEVDLSACSVDFGKLPSGQDEPTAEDASKFVELKGAKTVGTAAGPIAKDEQVCIRVRLPAAGASAAIPPLSDARE